MKRKSRQPAATGRAPAMVLSRGIDAAVCAGAGLARATDTGAHKSAALPRPAVTPYPGWEAALLMLVVFMIYVASPIITTGDSHFVIPTALSIIRHGDANIDEYSARYGEAIWAIHRENGHVWNVYPIGVPLLVLPAVWIWDKAARLWGVDLEAAIMQAYPALMDLCLASLYTAGAVALCFYYCRKRLSLLSAMLLAGLFAFGTPAYSSASRGLWQHGPSMLLFFTALLLYEALPRRGVIGALLLGAVAGFSYSVRPANALLIAGFGVLLAFEARRRLIPYIAGASLGLLPMLIYNLSAFGTLTSHYYRMTQDAFLHVPARAFVYSALLISPSRGLLIYSPFVLFVLLRLTRRFRGSWTRLDTFLASLCAVWFLSTGKWPMWAGGGSYGPRLLSELFPCLIVLLIPVVHALSADVSRKARIATTLFVFAGAISIAIHVRGATAPKPNFDWNQGPPDINSTPEKALSWKDPQFLRGWGSER